MAKALLVQLRNKDDIAAHEAACFRRYADRGGVTLESVNVYGEESDYAKFLEKYDAVIIGGSHVDPIGDYPRRVWLEGIARAALERRSPFLGICFGFELLAIAAGGAVEFDESRKEFGSHIMRRFHAADPIFGRLPESFIAQSAHKCVVSKVPEGFLVAAANERVPIQAIARPECIQYGTQFHPELRRKDMCDRMEMYNTHNGLGYQFSAEQMAEIKDSRHAPVIVSRFFELVRERNCNKSSLRGA